jgi:hypothetical protein
MSLPPEGSTPALILASESESGLLVPVLPVVLCTAEMGCAFAVAVVFALAVASAFVLVRLVLLLLAGASLAAEIKDRFSEEEELV